MTRSHPDDELPHRVAGCPEEAQEDRAWAQLWEYVEAGGFSTGAHLDARREHLAHERTALEQDVRELGTSGTGHGSGG